jgi:hypothetical protein
MLSHKQALAKCHYVEYRGALFVVALSQEIFYGKLYHCNFNISREIGELLSFVYSFGWVACLCC